MWFAGNLDGVSYLLKVRAIQPGCGAIPCTPDACTTTQMELQVPAGALPCYKPSQGFL